MATRSEPLSLTLTIPRDDRFIVTARGVAERVAEHAGRSADEAREISEAVNAVVAGIVEQVQDRRAGLDIAIRFEATDERLQIDIGYEGESRSQLEQALRRNGGRSLEQVNRAVDRVEFGYASGRDFCRLTRDF
jgi:hypothetical protein